MTAATSWATLALPWTVFAVTVDMFWPATLSPRTTWASDVAVAPPHGLVLEHVAYPADG